MHNRMLRETKTSERPRTRTERSAKAEPAEQGYARMLRTIGLLLALAWMVGCEKAPPMQAGGGDSEPSPSSVKPAATLPGRPGDPHFDFLHQPFERAVRSGVDAPEGTTRPPDMTLTGKSVGKLFSQIERGWLSVRFQDTQGRKIRYTAKLVTDLGEIELELMPELAPNHTRSFIALAEVGYFDGLLFETKEYSQAELNPARAIAGGSPRGDGDDMGSIGYWLMPEILVPEEASKRDVKHRAGMVGMRHGVGADTAGCRFYICLTEAPTWDGEFTLFGKVTKGLEIVEKIYALPTQAELGDPRGFEKPPVIHRVTISFGPLEK